MTPNDDLVQLSTTELLLSMAPLVVLAIISSQFQLELAGPIAVGAIRSFLQLTILGLILKPLFDWGEDLWWLVVLYVCVMVLLAAVESSSRAKYYFRGQLGCVLTVMLANVGVLSLYAFGVIIRPDPLWAPQYVIPIVGMLLGNSINGVSLSLNAMNTFLVEQQREVELLLSFGANSLEASSRLAREAVRTGAMPILNSMAVIGVVYIPGMMTGQILGGTPVMQAARYQMMIVYLIAICAFGTIFAEIWIAARVGFDSSHMLRVERFLKRDKNGSALARLRLAFARCCCCCDGDSGADDEKKATEGSRLLGANAHTDVYTHIEGAPPSSGSLKVLTMRIGSDDSNKNYFQIRSVTRSVGSKPHRRALFRDLTATVGQGEIAAVRGPSGAGKSQLLRVVAALSPLDDGGGDVILEGVSLRSCGDTTLWRRDVRYVTQYKVDIPGTPMEFLCRITSFQSWRGEKDLLSSPRNKTDIGDDGETTTEEDSSSHSFDQKTPDAAAAAMTVSAPKLDQMVLDTSNLLRDWGLDPSTCLDREWSVLSGGEAQRIILALAMSSRPKVLLLDESTSALDLDTKTRVERTVEEFASKFKTTVLWITHDEDQADRLAMR